MASASTEEAPLDPSEFVYRRVLKDDYKSHLDPPLTRGAFTPNKGDTDGLSFYRASSLSAAQLKAAGRRPADDYIVCRIRVADLLKLLILIPKQDDSENPLPGHHIAPAFNYEAYNDP